MSSVSYQYSKGPHYIVDGETDLAFMDDVLNNVIDDMDHFILQDTGRESFMNMSTHDTPSHSYTSSNQASNAYSVHPLWLNDASSSGGHSSHSSSNSIDNLEGNITTNSMNYNNANNNNSNHIHFEKSHYRPHNMDKLQLRNHVYISKDCTQRLSQLIVKESWGPDNVLLYKYLDYIFRCQIFDKQMLHIVGPRCDYLIMHTGLQRRSDQLLLYMLLTRNTNDKPYAGGNRHLTQQWSGPHGESVLNSLLCASEVIHMLHNKHGIHIEEHDLPRRSIDNRMQCMSDLWYHHNYSIQVNWEERLTTNADRIRKVIGPNAFFDKANKFLKLTELMFAFNYALAKTRRVAQLNARLAVPQCFVDSKHCKYRMELLLPLLVQYPVKKGNYYQFALAIGKSNEQSDSYIVKSILTLDMAYSNARLVGYVDSLWLSYGANYVQNNNTTNTNTNMQQPSGAHARLLDLLM